jgi:hypothetical protein
MVTLGLAPPYVLEDVKAAYRDKAKQLHPDRGGTTTAFNELHQAFVRAQAYLEFRSDRRAWIAAKMSRYVALENAVVRLQKLGAEVVTLAPEWLENSFGEFAQLTETAFLVRAIDAPNGDEIIEAMVDEYASLRELEEIELPGCRVTDETVLALRAFQQLKRLNLARTPVTRRCLAVAEALPMLESLGLDGSNVGWWNRRLVNHRLRRRLMR